MVVNQNFWNGKRVFVTGHTGFKGGWLSLWLSDMGAKVYGYALEPPTDPNFFTVSNLPKKLVSGTIADIRNIKALKKAMKNAEPQIVFHLAAQPLVRYSYQEPSETYAVNVMGTLNLLEAVRDTESVRALVNVTTDKCYENREWIWGYRENEALGGYDPYSSSKACSEILTSAYRRSFLTALGIHVATARAGNVIGGGDWAEDRLIPDFFRAADEGNTLNVRSPGATRPWQHVLDPLSGYLSLAEKLYSEGEKYASAWNFGPSTRDEKSVGWLIEFLCARIEEAKWETTNFEQPHEANYLKLDSSKAKNILGWESKLKLERALEYTMSWHQSWKSNEEMDSVSLRQIHSFEALK